MNVLIKTLVLVFVVSACPYQSLHGEEGASRWKKHVIHSGEDCFTVIAADFTGDGRPDIISNSNNKTRLFVNPDWQEIVLADHPEHGFAHSEVIDVDGDGDDDYIGAQYSPGLIFWFERPDDPLREHWTVRLVEDQINGIHGLIRGDVDGDGKLDLLATSALPKNPFPDSLAWLRIPPKPREAARWKRDIFANHDAPGLTHYLGFGDVNGDGRPDAATGAKGGPYAVPGTGDYFAWWEAPADPTQVWAKHLIAKDQSGATNIHPADVNGDGKVDFIASRGHSRGVLWFESPDWKEHTIHATIKKPHCLVAIDMDRDGDVDAATGGHPDKLVAWFENAGNANFTTHIVGRGQESYDLRAIDIDVDGHLDLLVAGRASQNVVWYENPATSAKTAP